MKKRYVLFLSVLIPVFMQAQPFNGLSKLVASDRAEDDIFGVTVSLCGDYAIVGAMRDDEDTLGENTMDLAGSAYIFKRQPDGNWSQLQKIVASDRGPDDNFGKSVSLDGNYAIIGAFFDDEDSLGGNSKSNAGSAYIFERGENDHWVQVQKLTAPVRASDDWFGSSVSLSGNFAIVGAELEDHDASETDSVYASGSAYIFERNTNGHWEFVQKITSPVRKMNDYFGSAVSIWGNFALVSAPSDDENQWEEDTLNDAGAAYIFERDDNGYWQQIQKIVPSDRAEGDAFGLWTVSIHEKCAIIGSMYEDEDTLGTNTLDEAGSAYIFERDENGLWNQVKKITAHDRATGDQFGSFVSISDHYAVVNARYEDEDANGNNSISNAGSAYIFKRNPGENWEQIQKITAFERNVNDHFEYVAIDSNTIMVGAYFEDEDADEANTLNNSGSVYVYELCTVDTTLTVTACNSYNLNGQIYTESGTFTQVLTGAGGCDSVIVLNLDIVTVNISVTVNDYTLISDETDATYQWLDCTNDYNEIAGEINRSFTPVSGGEYSVEVTKGECVDTSLCQHVTLSDIVERSSYGRIYAYPNPTSGRLMIFPDAHHELLFIDIKDVLGNTVKNVVIECDSPTEIEIPGPEGIYLLRIESSGGQIARLKIIKQ